MLKRLVEEKKKLLVTIGVVVLALVVLLIVVFSNLSNSLDYKAIGKWESQIQYLKSYGAETYRIVKLNSDGSAVRLLINANAGTILEVEKGSWMVSGLNIVVVRELEYGTYPMEYQYDFFTDTLKNGSNVYRKTGN